MDTHRFNTANKEENNVFYMTQPKKKRNPQWGSPGSVSVLQAIGSDSEGNELRHKNKSYPRLFETPSESDSESTELRPKINPIHTCSKQHPDQTESTELLSATIC